LGTSICPDVQEPSLVYARPANVTGLETLEARSSGRLWTVYHDTFTFVLIHEGHGEFEYRRRVHAVDAGAVMCLEPGNIHRDRRIASSNDFSVFFVDPGVVAGMLGTDARRLPHFATASVVSPSLASRARDLRVALLHSGETEEVLDALGSLVRQAFAVNAERSPRGPGAGCADSPMVRRARQILRDSSRDAHSLTDLARSVGDVSPEHLIRKFTLEIGLTPHQYLIQLRVRDARRLLRRGVALSVAAERAGFCDPSHLHRHFRRIVGVTPGQYQRTTRVLVRT
jgi:AraC-like DNA-binding protein